MRTNFIELLKIVKEGEWRKFISMSLLIFCILFDYNLIFSLKDSLIVTNLGAEIIGFIELWAVLPAIFIFTLAYIKLTILIPAKDKIFYYICSFFIVFFLIFAFLLYPNLEALNPHFDNSGELVKKFPALKWFIIICNNWPLALLNIFCDLWINTMFCLLFWQYANAITPSEQARRFYPIFTIIGNFSLVACGILLRKASIHIEALKAVREVTILIIAVGLICMILFWYLYKLPENNHHASLPSSHSLGHTLSFIESLRLVLASKYLWYLALAVISYGFTINLGLSLWRAEVLKLYPSTETYLLYMGKYQELLGITSIIVMMLTSIIIRKFRWLVSAIITPAVMFFTGIIFYGWVSFYNYLILSFTQEAYFSIAALLGTIHITLAKSAKFSFFDTTKELAYIPLEENLKDKGKAAIDLLSDRVGKSGGALLQSSLFVMIPGATYQQFAPFFLIISTVIWIIWLGAILALNRQYTALTSERNNKNI